MSTRCHIATYREKPTDLRSFTALIYRYSDGYPDGVLPDIMPFLEKFKEARGIEDDEYCAARLLQHLCNTSDQSLKDMWNEIGDEEQANKFNALGHGICRYIHGDIEYFYAIYPDQVAVYKSTWGDNGAEIDGFPIKVVDIE